MSLPQIKRSVSSCFLTALFAAVSALTVSYPADVSSGTYLDSAHGSISYGVRRSVAGFPIDYAKANCSHCHEQHASIGGIEPNPTGGPDGFGLFYPNHTGQTDNFCLKCHVDISSFQSGGSLINRSYSYRSGGYVSDALNDIREAFSLTSPATSHNLGDIRAFINGKWGYTLASNPCVACHNPHALKGDPANLPGGTKSSGTRGYSPVSLPSLHSSDNNVWGLWGDIDTERMSNYTAHYQSPYRYGGITAGYEPDGSSAQNGSNLADYATFCTDCHNPVNTIFSSTLGRNLGTIEWLTEKHGKGGGDGFICVDPPYYTSSSCNNTSMGKVLACTDCHEPHGAPNFYLLRKEINGGSLSGTVSTGAKDYGYLCRQCHMDDRDYSPSNGTANDWEAIHHCAGDYPYAQVTCGSCHAAGGKKAVCGGGGGGSTEIPTPIDCKNCHYHRSSVTNADLAPATRKTF